MMLNHRYTHSFVTTDNLTIDAVYHAVYAFLPNSSSCRPSHHHPSSALARPQEQQKVPGTKHRRPHSLHHNHNYCQNIDNNDNNNTSYEQQLLTSASSSLERLEKQRQITSTVARVMMTPSLPPPPMPLMGGGAPPMTPVATPAGAIMTMSRKVNGICNPGAVTLPRCVKQECI